MKNKKNLLCLLLILSSAGLFAEQQEFFSEPIYDGDSEMPLDKSQSYYGKKHAEVSYPPFYSFEDWFDGPYATADWGGFRSYLENNGIVPVFTYLGNFAANPSGGAHRGNTVSSSVNLGVGLDLYEVTKIKALKNWSLVNTWVWRFGNSLTNDFIDNEFNVQQNFGSQTMRMQSLFLSYSKEAFGGGNFMLKFGRIAAGDNFMTKPIYWLYMNNAIDGNPVGVFKQTKFSAYPGSTWGIMTRLDSKEGYYFKAGVYQINNDRQDSPGMHGLDFSFDGALGVNANFELGWDINHDDSGRSPGNISVGLVADWYSAPHLDNPTQTSHFNPVIYVQADYMILNLGFPDRSKPSVIQRANKSEVYRDLRGLILWGVLQYAPQDNLAMMPLFVNGGLLFNAPFASRPDDVLCFGVAYGKYSNHLRTPQRGSYEIMLELNYKVQVNRFFFFQPDIQYIINTKGGEHPNAFVLGAQFGMVF